MSYRYATPSFMVNIDILEANIKRCAQICSANGKKLFPMTKTHKSVEIAKMQALAGADGFLAGTLYEADMLVPLRLPVQYAYPVAGDANLVLAGNIMKRGKLILSLDSPLHAKAYSKLAKSIDRDIEYVILFNTGLNRFGVDPEKCGELAKYISNNYPLLKFGGISSHPGQVYGCASAQETKAILDNELAAVNKAVMSLMSVSIKPNIIASGSTPTFKGEAACEALNVLHPGNYVFNDVNQIILGSATEKECALSILATVIAKPSDNHIMLDCGSKCLGLDRGAHGSTAIKGFGRILGHDELEISSLSEQVAKVTSVDGIGLNVGDAVRIIPNHACSAVNMTNYLIGVRKGRFERLIKIDMRDNSAVPFMM